jgi:hypothetical protein
VVAYDEAAHHSGPRGRDTGQVLRRLDRAVRLIAGTARYAPRPYRFVVLSDHGQSQGDTFEQRYGQRLEDLVERLTAAGEVVVTEENEQAGRTGLLRAGLTRTEKAEKDPAEARAAAPDRPEIVIASSGNLALIYLARVPGRVTLEEIEERHPALLTGLTGHPGIGWVMVRSRERGPVVLGPAGRRRLDDDRVEGLDPLLGFGPRAAEDLRRHDRLANTGDLVVNSLWDPVTQEVAAFEDLIGCHGGMGGWQNRPVLIHPREWPAPGALVGADQVHHLLCEWMERAGCRPVRRDLIRPG